MSVLRFISSSKYISAFTQILLTLAFSFLPLLFLAFLSPEMTIAGSNQKVGFISHFISFFKGGELSLYILSICGTITWLLVINHKSYSGLINGALLTAVIFIVLYVGIMLGRNLGFIGDFDDSKLTVLCLIYFTILVLWYVALICEKSRTPNDEVKSAKKLIFEATGEQQ